MEGATIGQYRVTEMIGQGGMGAVYAGEHALLGRPAAIKVLLPGLSQKQDVVMRFFKPAPEAKQETAHRAPTSSEPSSSPADRAGTLPRRDRDLRLVLRLVGHADKTVVVSGSRPITEHLKLMRLAPPAPRTKPDRDQSMNPFD